MKERVYATYWMETGEEPHRAAEIIAGEQSSGTFVVLPKETPELKERFGARIERLEIIDTSSTPSLPTPQQSSHPQSKYPQPTQKPLQDSDNFLKFD